MAKWHPKIPGDCRDRIGRKTRVLAVPPEFLIAGNQSDMLFFICNKLIFDMAFIGVADRRPFFGNRSRGVR